jgi:glycine cleavage system regulatory protein
MQSLVLTLIGPDRPGLVESVASLVASHGGNWLESRMSHLAGQFAGVLRIEVPADKTAQLEAALDTLSARGLKVTVARGDSPATSEMAAGLVEILGQDRPGIVRDISRALAAHGVNVEEITTQRRSAPMSGEMLFEASIRVSMPVGLDAVALRADLEKIAASLMVELRFG